MRWPGTSRVVVALLLSIPAFAQSPQKAISPLQKAQVLLRRVLTLKADPLTVQSGRNVHFSATWNAPLEGVVYRFDWGDGQTSDSKVPEGDHSYKSPGVYTTRVTAVPADTRSASRPPGVPSNEVTITVTPPPSPRPAPVLTLKANLYSVQAGQSIHFIAGWDRPQRGAVYHFDWGDGQGSDTQALEADHLYQSPGAYTARVTAGPANTKMSSRAPSIVSNTVSINVLPVPPPPPPPPPRPPVLTLKANLHSVQAGQYVHFTASWDRPQKGAVYRFEWGDGQTSDTQALEDDHAYQSPGAYTVRVTAGSARMKVASGTPSIVSNPVSIDVVPAPPPPPPPELTLKANVVSVVQGQTVRFAAYWNKPVDVATYHFVWGDGQTVETQVPEGNHAYGSPGVYTVRVVADPSDPRRVGLREIRSNDVSIQVSPAPPPLVLTLKANTYTVRAGEAVHFAAAWNRPVEGVAYRFYWGDGQTSDTQALDADYAYKSPGQYTARVTASRTDPRTGRRSGEFASNDVAIQVSPAPQPPVLTLKANAYTVRAGESVHFAASWNRPVTGAVYRFDWGDGQTSDVQGLEADHAYKSPGAYTVRAIASPADPQRAGRPREIASNEVAIQVSPAPPLPPAPTLMLTTDAVAIKPGQPMHVMASWSSPVEYPVYRFEWGDGQTSDSKEPQADHTYGSPGTYTLRVVARARANDQTLGVRSNDLVVAVKPDVAVVSPPTITLSVVPVTKEMVANRDSVLQASLDPPREDVRYEFEWGDGSLGNVVHVTGRAAHRYARTGSYTVVVTAWTRDSNPAPLQKRLTLDVTAASIWPLTVSQWLLILASAGGLVIVGRKVTQALRRTPGDFHVYAFSDAGTHSIARIERSLPHLSITLKPGMGAVQHTMMFESRAAADEEDHHVRQGDR